MINKIKKSMKRLFWAGIVGLALVGCAKATCVDANAVEEGLEYYIRIDKAVYDLGETIEILHRLTNVGDETLNVCDLGIYTLRLELTRPEGDTIFAPYYGPPFPPMPPGLPDIITLNPGECMETRWHITSLNWGIGGEWVEEPFSIVGQYSVKSKYNGYEPGPITLVPDALHFAIIPEPASIAIFSLGLATLLVRQKERAKCLN